MSEWEVIEELTDICIRQAEIIQSQTYALAALNAEAMADEGLRQRRRLLNIAGPWDGDEIWNGESG